MSGLYKNQLLQHKETGAQIRILEQDGEVVWTYRLTNKKELPIAYARVALEEALQAGDFVETKALPLLHESKITEAARRRQNQAYQAIEPLIKTPDIFSPNSRNTLIAARAKELNCSPQTLFKYLRLWWRNGQSKNSLTPNFISIGVDGSTANRGRKASLLEYKTYQVAQIDQEKMQEILETFYLKDELVTLAAAYQRLLEMHYSYSNEEGRLQLYQPGECPSENQFRYFASKRYSLEARIHSRKGAEHFALNHRPKLGSLRDLTHSVGEVYEMDATIFDTFLVMRGDRAKIIGKPTVYSILDRKSNLTVGFYVGLENASWTAAMQCLMSISEDKEALCQRYGIPYDANDWPAHAIFPKTLIADRGSEFLSESSNQIVSELGVTLLNQPARRADWKPHVENNFKQKQRSLADILPGFQPSNSLGKRQTRRFDQSAALTLEEFTRVFILAVIRDNKKAITHYRMEPRYIAEGMQPTPINIWNTEVRERAGLLERKTEEEVRFALLPRVEATVTSEGIRIGDCYYSAPIVEKRGWLNRTGASRFKVNASIDRRLVDTIYIHDKESDEGYFLAHLLEKCDRFRGLSFGEVEQLTQQDKSRRAEGKQLTRQLNADFHMQVAGTISNAIKQTEAVTKGKSRGSRRKDVVNARQHEQTRLRQTEAMPAKHRDERPPMDVVPMNETDRRAVNQAIPQSTSMQAKYQRMLDAK